jgi:hypothetical protein
MTIFTLGAETVRLPIGETTVKLPLVRPYVAATEPAAGGEPPTVVLTAQATAAPHSPPTPTPTPTPAPGPSVFTESAAEWPTVPSRGRARAGRHRAGPPRWAVALAVAAGSFLAGALGGGSVLALAVTR